VKVKLKLSLDDRGSIPGTGRKFFSSPLFPDRLWGSTQPFIQWVPGNPPPGAKRPVYEADHSPQSSAEDKNVWSYTSTPPHIFIARCLVKYEMHLHGVSSYLNTINVFIMWCLVKYKKNLHDVLSYV